MFDVLLSLFCQCFPLIYFSYFFSNLNRFVDDMAEVDDDDEEDYDEEDRANANELNALERCVRGIVRCV